MTPSDDRIPDLEPGEALERWLNKLRAGLADATVSSYQYRLKHFVEFCEREGIESMREVSGWDLETYETERRQHAKALTLNRELGTLQNFLEYCERIEIAEEGIAEKVDPPDFTTDDQVDDTQLPHTEAQALLEYYEEEEYGSRAHALLATAWYTGARLGAIRGLDVGDYHSDDALLEFHHRPSQDTTLKNGRDGERMVGIPGELVRILDGYLREHRVDIHDDYGRTPLFTSTNGRVSKNGVRAWMYLATVPCHYRECPHGQNPESCEYLDYSQASKCPSSRSPHQVRTGSITWQLHRGVPIEVVAERVNTSVRVLKRHYDKPDKREELEERRRHHIDRLDFGGDDDAE